MVNLPVHFSAEKNVMILNELKQMNRQTCTEVVEQTDRQGHIYVVEVT